MLQRESAFYSLQRKSHSLYTPEKELLFTRSRDNPLLLTSETIRFLMTSERIPLSTCLRDKHVFTPSASEINKLFIRFKNNPALYSLQRPTALQRPNATVKPPPRLMLGRSELVGRRSA